MTSGALERKALEILLAENMYRQKNPYIRIKKPKPIGMQSQMFHKLSMHINIPQRIENIAIKIAITMRNHLYMLKRGYVRKVNEFLYNCFLPIFHNKNPVITFKCDSSPADGTTGEKLNLKSLI